ncbi:tetratricopeptide repeat protein [Rhizobium sp. BR 315]|uniref:tetratricopeptide repeat protein n=1 Tax=Rhizobium sp. BR 315 TaxID=3040014 RepID=UPI003D35512F
MRQVIRNIYLFAASLLLAFGTPSVLLAGYDEGYDAYQAHDYARSLAEWKPLAEKGEVHAQYALGMLYKNGEGVSVDGEQARNWFLRAANQGHVASQYELAAIHLGLSAVSIGSPDRKQGFFWLNKAAEQNYAPAKSALVLLGDAPVYEPSSSLSERPPVAANETTQTLGAHVFGALYDVIGWIIAAALFVYLALGSGALRSEIQTRLPSLLHKRSVCLSLATLAAFFAVVQISHRL